MPPWPMTRSTRNLPASTAPTEITARGYHTPSCIRPTNQPLGLESRSTRPSTDSHMRPPRAITAPRGSPRPVDSPRHGAAGRPDPHPGLEPPNLDPRDSGRRGGDRRRARQLVLRRGDPHRGDLELGGAAVR